MSACGPGRPRATGPETPDQLVLSPAGAFASAGEAATFAFSAAVAVAFSSPAGLAFVAVVGAVADFGAAGAPAFGGADSAGLAAVPDFGFAAVPAFLADEVGLEAARGFAGADAVPAAGFAAVAAFGADAVPAAGFAAVGFDAVPAFGFAAVAVVVFAFGLRVLDPASRARCVRVVVRAGVPVLVPPARGVGAGLSAVVSGSWS
jgi:hypothetical protein